MEPSFPGQHGAPLFCMSFCLIFLLSAKPPLAKDWCAWVMYGSDCQELLKPIQFQDSGSHFLSFMAHLMNSHYQLTCFIIVKALIEMVFLKKKCGIGKKKVLSPHYFFLCPKLPGLRFTAPSFSYSVTCWPCRLASSLSFYSLVPGLLGLLFCLFGPFLVQMVNATESSSLEKVSELSH